MNYFEKKQKIMLTSEMIEKLNAEFSDSESESESEYDDKRYEVNIITNNLDSKTITKNVIDLTIPNYFNNLPFDIQEQIWKTYYSNNVLNKIIKDDNKKLWYYNWNNTHYFPVSFRCSLTDYRCFRRSYIDENGNDETDKYIPSGQSKVHFEYFKMYEEFYNDEEEEHLRDVYGSDYGTSAYYYED